MIEEKAEAVSGASAPTPTPKSLQNLVAPWKPGTSGNPRGRVRGSRNRVIEAVTEIYAASVEDHGAETIEKLRQKDPATWARLAMQFVPNKIETEMKITNPFEGYDLQDEYEAMKAYALARQILGVDRPLIELNPAELDDDLSNLRSENIEVSDNE